MQEDEKKLPRIDDPSNLVVTLYKSTWIPCECHTSSYEDLNEYNISKYKQIYNNKVPIVLHYLPPPKISDNL